MVDSNKFLVRLCSFLFCSAVVALIFGLFKPSSAIGLLVSFLYVAPAKPDSRTSSSSVNLALCAAERQIVDQLSDFTHPTHSATCWANWNANVVKANKQNCVINLQSLSRIWQSTWCYDSLTLALARWHSRAHTNNIVRIPRLIPRRTIRFHTMVHSYINHVSYELMS